MGREIVLLVTGFGRFPGAPFNPTERIARGLGGAFARRLARLGVRLERRILPVTWEGTPAALRALERDLAPDAVLHFGLAGRRRAVTVEARADNRNRLLSADADGRRAPVATIAPGRAFHLPSRVSLGPMTAALGGKAPTGLSNDAGAYLCNLALWTSLAQGDPRRPVVFVHVPRPRSAGLRRDRLAGRAGPGRPTMRALIEMAQAACLRTALEARLRRDG
jgi:pyroglutamyl-peptidase